MPRVDFEIHVKIQAQLHRAGLQKVSLEMRQRLLKLFSLLEDKINNC